MRTFEISLRFFYLTPAMFQKDPVKLYEELRSLDYQCSYALVNVEPKLL